MPFTVIVPSECKGRLVIWKENDAPGIIVEVFTSPEVIDEIYYNFFCFDGTLEYLKREDFVLKTKINKKRDALITMVELLTISTVTKDFMKDAINHAHGT